MGFFLMYICTCIRNSHPHSQSRVHTFMFVVADASILAFTVRTHIHGCRCMHSCLWLQVQLYPDLSSKTRQREERYTVLTVSKGSAGGCQEKVGLMVVEVSWLTTHCGGQGRTGGCQGRVETPKTSSRARFRIGGCQERVGLVVVDTS
jgi:hypothetical protein